MSDTELRAKFEAWAAANGYEVNYLPLVRQYDDGDTQDAWLGWKACAQLAAPVAAQEPIAWALWMNFDGAMRPTTPVFFSEEDAKSQQAIYGGEIVPLARIP